MFGWLKKKNSGSTRHPTQHVNAKDAARVLRREGFRCYPYIIAGVEVAGIDKKTNGRIYEVYRSQSRSTALSYLNGIPGGVIPESHYVVVETPQGNVGRDIAGLYDE